MISLISTAALKGTALLLFAWAVTELLRRSSADLRHRVWLAALCGLAALLVPVAVPEAVSIGVVYSISSAGSPVTSSFAVWPAVWAAGFLAVFLHFLSSVAQLYLLTRRAEKTHQPDVRTSTAIHSPLTWGLFRPVILLPAQVRDWSIAIAHERAHIERRDWMWQSLARIVAAIFWFHPLVWFALSRLRQEAELAVDDAVLTSGTEPVSYAEQLLEVARGLRATPQHTAVAMVRSAALSDRVSAILDNTRLRTLAGFRSRVMIAVAAFCAVPILAAFQARTIVPPPAPAAPAVILPQMPVAQRAPVLLAQVAPKPVPPPPPPSREPLRIGNGVSAPIAVSKTEPIYSEEAREAKVQGEVFLGLVIDENGIPVEITVTQSLEPSLDAAAIKAVEAWRFKPGMKEGQPVSVRATIAVQFRLL